MDSFLYKDLSYNVLGIAFKVHNTLGPGLSESAYQGALVVELKYNGIPLQMQQVYSVYRDEYVWAYIADIVVDGKIILELKSVRQLTAGMEAQIINYLRLSGMPVFNLHQ
ncbi:MAG: GxxExxY protein [Spirochaetales bacterium]|nr:GxxExxY protein [Spirochaetales bacterium]